jgi:hypothetical protein
MIVMKYDEEFDLCEMLLLYEVPEPRAELVLETKSLMREEMKRMAEAPSLQAGWIVMLVGLAFVMTLGLFYTFTVGTILSLTLPEYLTEILRYSLLAFTATGGAFISGVLMVFCFKQMRTPQFELA